MMYSVFKWASTCIFLLTISSSAYAIDRDGVVLEMYQSVQGTVEQNGQSRTLRDGMSLFEGDIVDITNAGGATLEFNGCRRSFHYGTQIKLDKLFCEGIEFFNVCGVSPDKLVEAGEFGRSASILLAGRSFEYIDTDEEKVDDIVESTFGEVEGTIERGSKNLDLVNKLSLRDGDYITITKAGGASIEFNGCRRTFEAGHQVLLDEFFCDGAAYLNACAIGNAGGLPVNPAVVGVAAVTLAGIAYAASESDDATVQPVSP